MAAAFTYITAHPFTSFGIALLLFLVGVAIRDLFFQRTHTIRQNYPIVGNLRYWLESIGPEIPLRLWMLFWGMQKIRLRWVRLI